MLNVLINGFVHNFDQKMMTSLKSLSELVNLRNNMYGSNYKRQTILKTFAAKNYFPNFVVCGKYLTGFARISFGVTCHVVIYQ